MNYVFIVSDSTGKTAELTLNAALVQFPGAAIMYKRRPGVKTKERIKEIVKEAAREGGIIVHTMVSDEMRDFMVRQTRLNNVENIDLMGPLLSRLSYMLSTSPSEKPGLFDHLNEEYFRRVETMNFAFKHDDGLRTDELYKAEIVLVGISRTFKTPLSVYLAFKRWLVANVPVILNMELPRSLYDIAPERVFCLTTNAKRLAELRSVRNKRLKESTGDYSMYDYVRKELLYARRLYNNQPKWSVIDVTNKSIEEIASEIIALVRVDQSDEADGGNTDLE